MGRPIRTADQARGGWLFRRQSVAVPGPGRVWALYFSQFFQFRHTRLHDLAPLHAKPGAVALQELKGHGSWVPGGETSTFFLLQK